MRLWHIPKFLNIKTGKAIGEYKMVVLETICRRFEEASTSPLSFVISAFLLSTYRLI